MSKKLALNQLTVNGNNQLPRQIESTNHSPHFISILPVKSTQDLVFKNLLAKRYNFLDLSTST